MIIAIEGVDKAGKQTQSIMLKKALEEKNISTMLLHFPVYETPVGATIRQHLGSRGGAADRATWRPEVLHCLQAANKWENYYLILDAVKQHDVVIMDRYTGSNIAYGMANGMPKAWISRLEQGLPRATHTILLDIPVGRSFSRRPRGRDAFERDREFLERVRDEYIALAKREKGWAKINADKSADAVHQSIIKAIMPYIENHTSDTKKRIIKGSTQGKKKKTAGR